MQQNMRDWLDIYEAALHREEEQEQEALMKGKQKANDAFDDNPGIEYFNKDQYDQKEKIDRLNIAPTGKAQNPVDQMSLGKDQDNKVSPNFSSGPKLEALHALKTSLEALQRFHHQSEYKIGDYPKNSEEIAKTIAEMQKQIDVLSDDLVDDYVK